jgi:outer membrane protein assembly factor BamB
MLALVLALPSVCLADWPQFRGPTGQGIVGDQPAPVRWSETENVSWKTPLPGIGWSSPVVADGVVWLTTATEGGRSLRVLSVDAASGKLTRNVEIFRSERPPYKHEKNSFASPTPILSDGRVYVHFGAKGTAALNLDGTVLWRNTEHRYQDVHGSGGSPVLWRNLLIFNCDGADVQYVVALEASTGKTVWREPRNAQRFSFSTPLLIPKGASGQQAVSTGADMAASYDPETGKELWRITFDGFSVVPRPVYGNGMVYLTTGFYGPLLLAVRADGQGDVTATHIAWRVSRGVPLISSPLLDGERIYIVNDSGIASCINALNGRELWRQRLPGTYSASPVLAHGRVYFLNETGETTIVQSSNQYLALASNKINGNTSASLAFGDGAMFLRSDTALYRIEN